jgi:ParB family chromosome partitioning protein
MTERKRLGRGLDALIPTGDRAGESNVRTLPVDRIVPNPSQPRQRQDRASLEELAASITAHGVIQPVIVTEVTGTFPLTYQLVAGERRWRAAQIAGLTAIPALVKELSPREVLELALVENLQREDLNPLEEAEAYQMLADEFKLSHEEIAKQVGRSRPAVSNSIRLLLLPDPIREKVVNGELSAGHARALLALPTVQLQVETMRAILQKALSVRQTEQLVQRLVRASKRAPRPQPAAQADTADLETRLRESLGTRVSLTRGRKGGRVTIYFYSDEELDQLVQRLGG